MTARVIGLDISTCTGFAFWDANDHHASIVTGVLELPPARTKIDPVTGEKKHDYNWDDWRVAQMGPKIQSLLKEFRPEFVLVEERMRHSKNGDAAFSMSQAIHGAVYSRCCTMDILFGTINVQSWREPAYGKGFKQPLVPAMDRQGRQKVNEETGKQEFKKKDWGDIAVEKCNELGIDLPSSKEIAHNAAEAALIAMMWRCKNRIKIPSDRDVRRYVDLLQREKRAASVGAGKDHRHVAGAAA